MFYLRAIIEATFNSHCEEQEILNLGIDTNKIFVWKSYLLKDFTNFYK